MTRFECPRCQHVFSAETADEQAFADCPKCSSLALPTDEPSDAGSDTIGRMFGSTDIPVTDEHPSMTSADAFQPPPQAARPGIFTDLVGNETAPSFEQGATAVHSNPMASKMPASLFAAPPSLEGVPVDGPLSPFASAEGAFEDAPEEEDLYRAATEAFTPTSDDLPTGAAGAFGLAEVPAEPPPLDPLALTPLPEEPQPLVLTPLPLAPGAAAAPWGGLPTPSSDGPVVDEPRGSLSIDPATGLQTLSPLTEMATEVDERPEGLDAALAADVQVGIHSDVDSDGAASGDPSEEGESVFSGAGDAAIRPSILVEPEPHLPTVEAGGAPPSGIIIDPALSLEPPPDPPSEPEPAVSSSFEDIDAEGTDLSPPATSLPESLGAIEASQEGAALDDPDAAALFAGANFDDLEAAFDEVATRATDPGAPQEGDLDRAEDALRRASSDNFIYERPPDDDSDGLGVPSAPTAPVAPQLTLKKESQLPHLSLSQSTIEAVALPLHGGSFVTEDSMSGPVRSTSASHAIGDNRRYTNPALDEPTLVTRERDEPKKPVRHASSDTQVPKLMSGLTPLRVGALLFFACVLGTVFGALIAPGKKERPITARVRAENQIMEGNRAYEAGKLDDALGYYRGAVARDATYGIGHRAMASVLAKKKRDEEAARAYRTYLELTPGAVDEQQVRDILRRYDPKALPPQSDAATTTDKVNK